MSYAEELFAKTYDRMIEAREYKLHREVADGVRIYVCLDGKNVLVYFSVFPSLNKKSLEEINNSITQFGCKGAIVACKSKTSSSNNDAFKRIEFINFDTFLVDPTNIGGGAVTIRKLKSDETKPDPHCIATMLTSDKVARFLDCKPGDIIVVTRRFPNICPVPFMEYRVVQTTGTKSADEMFEPENEDGEGDGDDEGDDEGDGMPVGDDDFVDEEEVPNDDDAGYDEEDD